MFGTTTFTTEMQIVLAICVFYLYDACIPLHVNEGLMTRGWRAWRCQLAANGYEMRRAFLTWPHILLPHQPVYRLAWQATDMAAPGAPGGLQHMQDDATRYRAFHTPLYALASALFLLLPASLLLPVGDLVRLAVLLLVYAVTVWICMLCFRHGRRYPALRAQARSIGLQLLLCPPFALNAVRKLSLLQAPPCSLTHAATALLPRADWQQLARQLHGLVDEEFVDESQRDEEADPVRLAQLQASRLWLAPHRPSPEE